MRVSGYEGEIWRYAGQKTMHLQAAFGDIGSRVESQMEKTPPWKMKWILELHEVEGLGFRFRGQIPRGDGAR